MLTIKPGQVTTDRLDATFRQQDDQCTRYWSGVIDVGPTTTPSTKGAVYMTIKPEPLP